MLSRLTRKGWRLYAPILSVLALPAVAQTTDAQSLSAHRAATGHARVVSGTIRFPIRPLGARAASVAFKIDGHRVWVSRHRPFRFRATGKLNTHNLANGRHVLAVRVVYRNHTVRQFSTSVVVRNVVKGPAIPAKAPNPTATAASVGVQSPPAGGVPGPSPADFEATQYNYAPSPGHPPVNSQYQVMVLQSTSGPFVAALHAANPGLKVFMYIHPGLTRATDPGALSVCTPYQSDLTSHPDWFLHDQYGRIIQSGPLQNFLMNQGNPSYQQACVAHTIALAKTYGFDGIFFDGVVATLAWSLPAGLVPVEAPNQTAWQNAMTSFVNYAGPAIHAQGLKVLGNMNGVTITSGLWQKWTAPLDGGMEEAWTDGGLGVAQQRYDWGKKLANVAWSEANGKLTLLHSYNTSSAGNTYGLASMLLVANGNTSYSTSNADYGGYAAWYPDYSNAQTLGAPAGPYTKLRNGVYERVFSGGIVLVNPNPGAVPSFSLGGHTYSGSGLINVASVSMPGYSAEILRKVG